MNQAVAAPAGVDLVSALADCHAQPLWDRYHRVTRRAPAAPDAPWHWPWERMAPLVDRAVAEVSMEDAERRVLLLTHPAFAGSVATTTNLSSGLQTLLPGEIARAHRHTLQAIRFVMQGQGAVTSVNAHRCAMAEGDLILTPAWTWHEHVHPGTGRMVWFDGLDLPLSTHLDTMFFEMAGEGAIAVEPPPTRSPALRVDAAALRPDAADGQGADQGSRYRFSWERVQPVGADRCARGRQQDAALRRWSKWWRRIAHARLLPAVAGRGCSDATLQEHQQRGLRGRARPWQQPGGRYGDKLEAQRCVHPAALELDKPYCGQRGCMRVHDDGS